MAPSTQLQRVIAAVKAMKLLGFGQEVAKAVLKELLRVFGNNWEYIEAENYRLLADAILDSQESKDHEANEKNADVADELPKLVKRPMHIEDPGPSKSTIEPEAYGEALLKKKKLVASGEDTLINLRGEISEPVDARCSYRGSATSLSADSLRNNGTVGIGEMAPSPPLGHTIPKLTWHTTPSCHQKDEQYSCDRAENLVCYKEPKIELDTEVLRETAAVSASSVLDKPKDVPNNDSLKNYNVPIAVVTAKQGEAGNVDVSGAQLAPNKGNGIEIFQVSAQNELANVQERLSTNVNIASSNLGKEDAVRSSPPKKSSKISQSPGIHCRMTRRSFNGSPNLASLETQSTSMNGLQSSLNLHGESNDIQENCAPESSGNNVLQYSAILPLHENAIIASSPRHDEHDIAKGEESMKISVINEFNSERTPPYFHYIPWNVIYQNAHVNFSLAQVGEDDCCIDCFGNCLGASIPCACTRETGGEFVYTLDGLLKKEFLNECISMSYITAKRFVYCKNCPMARFKGEDKPVSCKGHLVKKFIKECWSKCGCNKQCGNRVVQRGIARNLQVFYTANGKGWGLRTLEDLPRGAFVCEYVGEVLTNSELYDRTVREPTSAKHAYTLVLDADWVSEEGLRDEEALCLDATFYGNVGRFVNHRCFDANLVEVPVEWETPDHHYYHLAYFTTRKVEALEELTWDYGIDFKDCAHPFKTFKCLCGSRFCRDSCRSKTRNRESSSK